MRISAHPPGGTLATGDATGGGALPPPALRMEMEDRI